MVPLNAVYNKIRLQIWKEDSRFKLEMLSERAIHIQEEVYLYFIDYTTTFYWIWFEEIFVMLEKPDLVLDS